MHDQLNTQCTLRSNPMTGKPEIIIPTFDTEQNKLCTDIFDVETMTWKAIEDDDRNVKGGYVLSNDNKERVFYLGGIDSDGKRSKSVYELKNYKWVRHYSNLPTEMGGNHDNVIPVGLDFCMEKKQLF